MASKALTGNLLRGRSGPRDFSRVIVVGALTRNNGIASGARLQWAALRQLGVDVEMLDATPALRNPLFRIPHAPGSLYIFHADGIHTVAMIRSVLPHAAWAWRIGNWNWELPDPPLDWSGCERYISEVWTPSSYSRNGMASLFNCPMEVVPYHIPASPARQRAMDMPFTVLTMADSRSSLSRKNPEGALRAFHAAFGSSTSARLILKLGGRTEQWRMLEQSVGDILKNANIEIIERYVDDAALTALYRRADVLLSLHRAEGFGLPMKEAMAHGVPVVGTGWSANSEFMSTSDSCLVPYGLVPVTDVSSIYSGSMWAEPDVGVAAQYLRRLADDPVYYAQLATAAHRRVSDAKPYFPFAVGQTREAGLSLT